MLQVLTKDFSPSEWTSIVSRFEDLSLLQTWAYAQAKVEQSWEVRRTIFTRGADVIGATQELIRRVPVFGGGLAWINRGPLWRQTADTDVSILLELLRALRATDVDRNGLYLRVAPPIREQEIDSNALHSVGLSPSKSIPGWASARVDLSLPLDDLRARLDKKWRNVLSKAQRSGVTLRAEQEDVFEGVMEQYESLLREKLFGSNVTPSFLRQMRLHDGHGANLWPALALSGQKTLGGVVVAMYGDTAEYLVGAVNAEGRTAGAGHFLLWEAVSKMKELGYRWFDLGGMDEKLTPAGIFHFKQGLAGSPYRLIGDFEAHNGRVSSRLVRWRVNRARGARA